VIKVSKESIHGQGGVKTRYEREVKTPEVEWGYENLSFEPEREVQG